MTGVLPFPRKRMKGFQVNRTLDIIEMMKLEAGARQCSHVFAALVHDDGTVSRWSFSAAEIEQAAVFRDLLSAIDLLRSDAFTTVVAGPVKN